MKRRVLVIEPDSAVRQMMEYALSAAGYAPSSVPTIEASHAVVDAKQIDVVVVELRATNTEGIDGVHALRADYPELPLVATGSFLSPRLLQDLLRARVDDVVPKPFTPGELTEAVARVLQHAQDHASGAQEYAAAMAASRRAILDGRLADAQAPLVRAHAALPLDSESMALLGLVKELTGQDLDAARAYRAAIALGQERVTDDALPSEGLSRLAGYAGARVVPELAPSGYGCLWFIANPTTELALGPPSGAQPDVVVFALGLAASETCAVYSRLDQNKRGFLIASSSLSERLALRVAQSFDAPLVVGHPLALERIGAAAQSSESAAPAKQAR